MSKPKIISLYTGAGGLDFGLEAAGFDTVVSVELDGDCCDTIRQSRPMWRPIQRGIAEISTKEILKVGRLKQKQAALVVGGPPCQPFSKSSYWSRGDSRRLNDPRAATLAEFLRVVEDALPQAFLLENVGGLAYNGKDEGLTLLLEQIKGINERTKSNYVPYYRVVQAADYGVPQLRERFILVAHRDGKEFRFPNATHAPPPAPGATCFGGLAPYRTAWDAIGGLTPAPGEDLAIRGKWGALLPSIPEGENYLWHTGRKGGRPLFGWRTKYWGFLLKLAKDRPAWTVQAQPGPAIGPFHWENRRLSVQELCRIQTFPEDVSAAVRFFGERGSIQRQVGNAVPSLLAEVLGRAIRTQLLGYSPVSEPLKLLPARRNDMPAAEPLQAVPQQYLHLEGAHAEHPGEGKGPGARARARGENRTANAA